MDAERHSITYSPQVDQSYSWQQIALPMDTTTMGALISHTYTSSTMGALISHTYTTMAALISHTYTS